MKSLYECSNGLVGESYFRVYVWATESGEAEMLARQKFLDHGMSIRNVRMRHLFYEKSKNFCTEPSDTGFEFNDNT